MTDRKNENINIRVTAEQSAKIKDAARKAGMTVTAYLVYAATNFEIVERLKRIEENQSIKTGVL
jgi:uncharacterized protein (DUF1778 family)